MGGEGGGVAAGGGRGTAGRECVSLCAMVRETEEGWGRGRNQINRMPFAACVYIALCAASADCRFHWIEFELFRSFV